MGPYNIGGRVTDVVADRFTPNARLRGGLGRRHLEDHRRRRQLDAGLAGREHADDGRVRAGAQRRPVGRHRRGQPARRRPDLLRRRHLQVDRQRRALDQHGADRERRDRAHRGRSDELAAGVRGGLRAHRPLGPRPRPVPHDRRRQDAGSSCSRRRTRRPARSTSPSTRRTRRSSTRRCGITRATTARAPTAASAPACSAPRTAATRGSGCRTSSTRCRPMTQRRPA